MSVKWNDRLVCNLVGVVHDFRSGVGRLHMAEGNCCDMAGCIELRDTTYDRRSEGWVAYPAGSTALRERVETADD
jgi:hypothetical protein